MESTSTLLPGSVGEDELNAVLFETSSTQGPAASSPCEPLHHDKCALSADPRVEQHDQRPTIDSGDLPKPAPVARATTMVWKHGTRVALQKRRTVKDAAAKEAAEKQLHRALEELRNSHAAATQHAAGGDHSKSPHHHQSAKDLLQHFEETRTTHKAEHDWPDPALYNHRSFYLFDLKHPVRRFAIAGLEWRWRGVNVWETTVLVLILLNTVQLAMYDPFDIPALKPVSPLRDAMEGLGKFFSAVFLAECVVKVLALGFFVGRHTYLDDAFNYLDLFIVIVGVMDFFPSDGSSSNLSALRSLRVMRPLKLVTKFKDLREVVVILLSCIPDLNNAVGLVCFILLVFGILGVQLFQGVLRGVCFSIEDGSIRDSPSPCGYLSCGDGFECLTPGLGENPSRGVVTFDYIGSSMMTVYQVMTYEGWNDAMYALQDSASPFAYIYFLFIIALGPIFALQLFLVVISNKYSAVKAAEHHHAEVVEEKEHHAQHDALDALLRKVLAEEAAAEAAAAAAANGQETSAVTVAENGSSHVKEPADKFVSGEAFGTENDTSQHAGYSNHHATSSMSTSPLQHMESTIDRRAPRKRSFIKRCQLWLREIAMSEGLQDFVMAMIILSTFFMASDAHVNLCEDKQATFWSVFRFQNDYFFSRAGEKHTIPTNPSVVKYKAVVEGSNIFFTAIFVVELLIKFVGYGPTKFFFNGATSFWNIFDLLIVVLSCAEVHDVYQNTRCLLSAKSCLDVEKCSAGFGFGLLRVFRLARLGKLLRKFPDMYKQLKAMGKSVGAVGALMVLIALFNIIFLILGMNVFGGSMVMEFDSGELGRGANVYVELPVDAWRDERPPGMPGRPGQIKGVDGENHADTPWQVCVLHSTGLERQLGLDENGCVWASDDNEADFADQAVITGIVPRLHYDQIFYALITTFQIFTTANWNDNLYDAAAASGPAAALYFYAVIVIGNWMLLNMFIAIVIQRFAEQRNEAVDAQLKNMKKKFIERFGLMNHEQFTAELLDLFRKADADGSGLVEKRELQELLRKDVQLDLPERDFTRLYKKYDQDGSGEIDTDEFIQMMNELLREAEKEIGHAIEATKNQETKNQKIDAEMLEAFHQEEAKLHAEHVSYALYCLAPTNPLRAACMTITTNVWFDRLILFCIFFSSLTLALDSPLMQNTDPLRPVLAICDYIFNFIFIAECLGKTIAQTFRTYISSAWSKLDVVIVFFAIVDMIASAALGGGSALGPLKTVRILRALRPLRLIARAKGLRTMINAMFSSVKPIIGTICIALGVYSLLGLVGMQIFLGKMGTCTDNKIQFMRDCWGPDDDGAERHWIQASANFNNLPQSVVTMFTLASQDNWPAFMFEGIDSVGAIQQPMGSKYNGTVEYESFSQNANPGYFFFYFICIMVGGYLVLNMFVSVFVDGYLNASEEMKQNDSSEKVKLEIPEIEDPPEHWLRGKIVETVSTTEFDMLIAFFIVCNVLAMAFESYKQASWQTDLSNFANLFFTIIFGWECLFKLLGFGGGRYFKGGWERFDYFIVIISYLGMVLDNMGDILPMDPSVLRVLRIFRVFRILRAFRVFKAARGLQLLVESLASSLPALANLGCIFVLVFFVFAALAVSLFGTLCVEGEAGLAGMGAVRCFFAGEDVLGLHGNFRHFGEALGTLFRAQTGDAWADILNVIARSPADHTRTVTAFEWDKLSGLLGYDPRELNVDDPRYNAELVSATSGRMELAKISIRHWNASVYGMDADPDWPTPASVPEAADWISMASLALPGCLTDEQVSELEREGLMDCSQVSHNPTVYDPPAPSKGNMCQSSCSVGGELNYVVASFFFACFIILSNFVLLQLVIAVLMEQLEAKEHDHDIHTRVPGCEELEKHVFDRIYRRFRRNAIRRLILKRERIARRAGAETGTADG